MQQPGSPSSPGSFFGGDGGDLGDEEGIRRRVYPPPAGPGQKPAKLAHPARLLLNLRGVDLQTCKR